MVLLYHVRRYEPETPGSGKGAGGEWVLRDCSNDLFLGTSRTAVYSGLNQGPRIIG